MMSADLHAPWQLYAGGSHPALLPRRASQAGIHAGDCQMLHAAYSKVLPMAGELVPGLWTSEASCLMPTDSGWYPRLLPASLLRWRALCGDSMEACLLDLAPVSVTLHIA